MADDESLRRSILKIKEVINHVENALEGSTVKSTSEGEGKAETAESSGASRDARVAQNFRYVGLLFFLM